MAPKPAPGGSEQSKKRKQRPPESSRPQKRQKPSDPRRVKVQSTDEAYKNGELDVAKFVQAREFAIKALESSMRTAAGMRNSRAFQQMPRELRRRTASHNVKKVPKRLRGRATKEMKADNTPTVERRRREPTPHLRLRLETAKSLKSLAEKQKKKAQSRHLAELEVAVTKDAGSKDTNAVKTRAPRVKKNVLKGPDKPRAKFRKRQINKTWLPTHLYHAKRAHLTSPREPLWRFAIPLTPALKGYRPTHRASTIRGAIAWDVSYMSTIGLEGPQKSMEGLLKALGVGSDDSYGATWGRQGQRWRNGTRTWSGWLFEREKYPEGPIAPATIIWCPPKMDSLSAHRAQQNGSLSKQHKRKLMIRVSPSAFKQLWEEVVRLSKVQKPAVDVEDLRFEIGSINVAGPQSTEALVGVLRPRDVSSIDDDSASVQSPEAVWNKLGSITNPATLPSNVMVSFSINDPRLRFPPRPFKGETGKDSDIQKDVLDLCARWPLDENEHAPLIFERNFRLAAQRSMRSQKSINRRKGLAGLGSDAEYLPTDPRIPVLLYTSTNASGPEARWTILMPWKCLDPVWRSLMYYPLSTGGQVRLGCLKEQRQLAFEAGVPWFPGDFPGSKAGDDWEEQERVRRKSEWERRPKSKRVAWDSVRLGEGQKGEIGRGWACDWEHLFRDEIAELRFPKHVPTVVARSILAVNREDNGASVGPEGLVTVKVTLLAKGVPQTCARIYRLPTTNDALRQAWLSLKPKQGSRKVCARIPPPLPDDAPTHLRNERLAQSLLNPGVEKAGNAHYPSVPTDCDLVGFVTTGNFNLGEGKGIGIGALRLTKIQPVGGRSAAAESNRLCIVRDAGQTVGRLAKWELA